MLQILMRKYFWINIYQKIYFPKIRMMEISDLVQWSQQDGYIENIRHNLIHFHASHRNDFHASHRDDHHVSHHDDFHASHRDDNNAQYHE